MDFYEEEYYENNHHINDVKQLCDNIYYLRRNIKEYIKAIKENTDLNEFLEKQFSVMIDKLETINEDVFWFTQYAVYNEYNNVNIDIVKARSFYEDVYYTKGYIEGILWYPKKSFKCIPCLRKNYSYIIMDLEKLFKILVDLCFIVGGYVKFLEFFF